MRILAFHWLAVFAGMMLLGCSVQPPSRSAGQEGPTGVQGQVLDRLGQPAADAWVYAYRSQSQGLRGPADFGAPVDADGSYFLDLVAGEYWLVARQRKGRAISGPPRSGDDRAPFARNPIRIEPGWTGQADFLLQTLSQPRAQRQGALLQGDTGYSGRLVDESGAPMNGAFALAYRGRDQRRMPDYTSLAVGADGRFVLYVEEAGDYCLAARRKIRGQPQAGEPFGRLGRGVKGCRKVKDGEILEVGEIVLRDFQP